MGWCCQRPDRGMDRAGPGQGDQPHLPPWWCCTPCTPAPATGGAFLKDGGQYSDAEIVELVVRTCFDGLSAR
jgi:hypothetical protein